jgi:hypothetical protein
MKWRGLLASSLPAIRATRSRTLSKAPLRQCGVHAGRWAAVYWQQVTITSGAGKRCCQTPAIGGSPRYARSLGIIARFSIETKKKVSVAADRSALSGCQRIDDLPACVISGPRAETPSRLSSGTRSERGLGKEYPGEPNQRCARAYTRIPARPAEIRP